MSLREDCRDWMSLQLDRQISDNKADDIEKRVRAHMKLQAMEDPEAWRQLPYHERLQQAASAAAKDMADEFRRKQQIVQKQMEAHDRIENILAADEGTEPKGAARLLRFLRNDRLSKVSRLLDFDTRGGSEGFSVYSRYRALKAEMDSNLLDLFKAVPGHVLGLFEDRRGVMDLWKELHGESSGNATARAGAEAFHKVAEEARNRFNDGGGQVGRLEDWHVPQHHSQERVAKAGIDKWTADILPKLNRDHYLNEDGSRMSNDQMEDFLSHAYDSIITDGQNSREPGNVGGLGMIANRNAAHRALHFKDAQSHAEYNTAYGENSLATVLQNHVNRMARDIALVERLGPNAERTFKFFNDRALTDELRSDPTRANQIRTDHKFNENLFDAVAGRDKVINQKVADVAQGFRNWMTATRLGKVVITALGDEAGMASTAMANKVPYSAALLRELQTLPKNSEARHAAESAALGLDAKLTHLNRFGQEEFGQGFTSKLAGKVMQLSGAERMWAARRQGMGAVLMSSIGRLTRNVEHITDLNANDHGVLANKGVTDNVWQTWRRAETEDWGTAAHSVLTPKSIWSIPDEKLADLGDPRALKREASTQLLAHVLEEAGMGAMDTGPRQRVSVNFGTQRGSVGGELWRSMNLFRSFAFSMMMKHWARASTMDGIGKAKYMAPLFLYGTLIAAAGNQVRNFLAGQNPDDMTAPGFWGKAILRGGGLGFFGDFLYNETTQHDTSLAAALGGPAATTVEDILSLTHGAFFKQRRGERTDELAKLIRFGRENIPFTNLWYTQAAFDHLLWNHMQEAASPGYLSRMETRQAQYGKTYFWHPGEALPSEAPKPEQMFARAP